MKPPLKIEIASDRQQELGFTQADYEAVRMCLVSIGRRLRVGAFYSLDKSDNDLEQRVIDAVYQHPRVPSLYVPGGGKASFEWEPVADTWFFTCGTGNNDTRHIRSWWADTDIFDSHVTLAEGKFTLEIKVTWENDDDKG